MDGYLSKLKEGGFKLTPRRLAIIRLFMDCRRHLSPEEVWARLKKEFVHCGLPGVYRNLESLSACGILTRIRQLDSKKHYGLCSSVRGPHHHITCVKCGRVDQIKGCSLEGVRKINGYKVIGHFMQVDGICADCSGK